MPVSPLPILVPFVMLCIVIGGIVLARLSYSRCRAWQHVAIAVLLLSLPALVTQIKGLVLRELASGGDAEWQLAYADWFIQERNLHQQIVYAPGAPWDGELFFEYLSDSAAQEYVPAMRKYMAWVEQAPARMEELQVRANYNAYRRQLGAAADYSYWRVSTLLNDLMPLYAAFAILVQLLFWRAEYGYQKELQELELADVKATVSANAMTF